MYDAAHALDHPETAGWALGALDPDDAAGFGEHLATCRQCQGEVAEFTPVAKSLTQAAPAAEPPADLEVKIVAAVRYAAMAESAAGPSAASTAASEPPTSAQAEPKPARTAKAHRWWHLHWTNPLFAALAAAAVTAAAFLGSTLFHAAPALAATIKLTAKPGSTGSGLATARHTHGGYKISLTRQGLADHGPGLVLRVPVCRTGQPPGSPRARHGGDLRRRSRRTRLSTCGAQRTPPTSRSCRSPSNSQETPASRARSSSPAPPKQSGHNRQLHRLVIGTAQNGNLCLTHPQRNPRAPG